MDSLVNPHVRPLEVARRSREAGESTFAGSASGKLKGARAVDFCRPVPLMFARGKMQMLLIRATALHGQPGRTILIRGAVGLGAVRTGGFAHALGSLRKEEKVSFSTYRL